MQSIKWLGGLVASMLLAVGPGFAADCEKPPQPSSREEAAATELRIEDGGRTFVVTRGDAYEIGKDEKRRFVKHFYDPDFFSKNYLVKDCQIFQKDPETGQVYRVTRNFREGFDGLTSAEALQSLSRWHTDNTEQRRAGRKFNFHDLGNRITISRNIVHSGDASARFSARASSRMVSKASLSKKIMYFKKGDDVYFSGWFYIEETPSIYDGGSFTLFDLESTFFQSVGLRVIFRTKDSLAYELELPKTQFRQDRGSEVTFPTGRWVHVETHAFLSDEEGRVEIWQDGRKVLDKRGRTLPLADTIYDKFEIGITAMAKGSKYDKILYADDLEISDAPIRN